jgi:hypothetical protein
LYSNIHRPSSKLKKSLTDSCLWIPTCYWTRHSLFYSFYYSRTRRSLRSRHMTQSRWLACVSGRQLLPCFFIGLHIYSHNLNTYRIWPCASSVHAHACLLKLNKTDSKTVVQYVKYTQGYAIHQSSNMHK